MMGLNKSLILSTKTLKRWNRWNHLFSSVEYAPLSTGKAVSLVLLSSSSASNEDIQTRAQNSVRMARMDNLIQIADIPDTIFSNLKYFRLKKLTPETLFAQISVRPISKNAPKKCSAIGNLIENMANS